MSKLKKVFIIAGILVVIYLIGLYVLQNQLLFVPDKQYIPPQIIGLDKFKEVSLQAADGTPVRFWYAAGDKAKPAILFLHGNAGQIASFVDKLDVLVQTGYGVLAMEYRSFAEMPGSIRQTAVFNDAVLGFDFLKKQGYSQIVVYGYSFGSAIAAGVTSLRSADGLILTSPFVSLKELASEKPVPLARWVLRDKYPSFQYISQFNKPLLIIHGEQDGLIPYHHAEKLFKLSPSLDKQLHIIEGKNHVSVYFDGANLPYILDFLKRFEK